MLLRIHGLLRGRDGVSTSLAAVLGFFLPLSSNIGLGFTSGPIILIRLAQPCASHSDLIGASAPGVEHMARLIYATCSAQGPTVEVSRLAAPVESRSKLCSFLRTVGAAQAPSVTAGRRRGHEQK